MFEAEFDVLLVGDEPAGLWLLEKYNAWRHSIGKMDTFAHVTLGSSTRPTWLSRAAAKEFEIQAVNAPAAECIAPHHSLVWEEASIREHFPDLPSRAGLPATGRPTTKQWSALRYALRRHPELYDVSQALWKRLGRGTGLHPESLLWHALSFTELSQWKPRENLAAQIGGVEIDPREHPLIQIQRLRDGAFKLEFQAFGTLVAKQVIWNTSVQTVNDWSRTCTSLAAWLPDTEGVLDSRCLVPLQVRAREAGINRAARPLGIWMDADAMVDADHEMWPFEIEHNGSTGDSLLLVWNTTHAPLALEAALDACSGGHNRMRKLFPFLKSNTLSLFPTPSVGAASQDCFDGAPRERALEYFEKCGWENYQLATYRTEGRKSGIVSLLPSLHAQYPYPVGPLTEARRWLEKRKKIERPKQKRGSSAKDLPNAASQS